MSLVFRIWSTLSQGRLQVQRKDFIPMLLLLVISLIGAGIMYGLENSKDGCKWSYWTSLYFLGTLFTTIGYGDVTPCSVGGKFFTCIFAIFLIPLALVTLDNIGRLLLQLADAGWRTIRCNCCCRRRKLKLFNSGRDYVICSGCTSPSDEGPIPFWLGILVTVFWIFVSVVFFSLTEGWNVLEGIYFCIISITTIGLGDFHPTQRQYTFLHLFFLVIGLALFSMCINLVLQNLDEMMSKMVLNIALEYKENISKDVEKALEVTPEHLQEMIKKHAGCYRFLLSDKAKSRLFEQYEKLARMRNVAVQTEYLMVDKGIDGATYSYDHKCIQVRGQQISLARKTSHIYLP